jgi:chromate transporter
MLFLQLFYTFFKIGLFGFGGGYAMLSMIQGEVVTRHGWISAQEFTDIVAISQMTPGPIGINSATFVGYSTLIDAGYTPAMAVLGSATATFAVILPSFILMLIISRYFLKFQKHPVVMAVFSGLRPAVVGLLAAAALLLMNSENFSSPTNDMRSFIISCLIFLVVFIATRRFKISPILMIVLSGVAGLLLYQPV